MEAEIKDALIRLLGGIKQSDTRSIAGGMDAIESALSRFRADLHPQLVHFLERRSYAKALDFLGGDPDAPTGAGGAR